jgi:hypothetical protein
MDKRVELQELEKQYAEMGGNVSHYAWERKLDEAKQEALVAYEAQKSAIAEQEQKRVGKGLGELAGKGLGIVSIGFTFVFVLAGSIVATLALFVAEYVAVYLGVSVIEPSWAWLYALALVSFYIVTLFIQEIIIAKHGYQSKERFSLRLLWHDLVYFFGGNESWQVLYEKMPDNAQAISQTVRFSTWAIIAFGLLGRFDGKLQDYADMAWHEALQAIALDSSLEDMLGYVSMFIATAALLYSTKWVIGFMYSIFKNVTGGLVMQDFSSASIVMSQGEMIEAYQTKMLQREIMKLEHRNKRA